MTGSACPPKAAGRWARRARARLCPPLYWRFQPIDCAPRHPSNPHPPACGGCGDNSGFGRKMIIIAVSNRVGAMKRQLHLNLFIHSRGHHEASWRHPGSSPLALTDIRYYQDLACRAEAASFDSIFLADQLALGDDVAQAARTWLEPVTVLAAVGVATSRIGMIAPASTTYTGPFNLARQFASWDHIKNRRRRGKY